jgi:hypothetical protein
MLRIDGEQSRTINSPSGRLWWRKQSIKCIPAAPIRQGVFILNHPLRAQFIFVSTTKTCSPGYLRYFLCFFTLAGSFGLRIDDWFLVGIFWTLVIEKPHLNFILPPGMLRILPCLFQANLCCGFASAHYARLRFVTRLFVTNLRKRIYTIR